MGLAGLAEFRAAGGAGGAGAGVDFEVVDEVAGLAFAADEIAEGGAAFPHGIRQYGLDGGDEFAAVGAAEAAGGAAGADAGEEQRFVGVDVAHAHHDAAIHNERFHGGFAAAGAAVEVSGGEIFLQGFGAEAAEEGVLGGVVQRPQHAAEAAGVVVAEGFAVGEADVQVVVPRRGIAGAADADGAGHAEMPDQGAGCGAEQEVFAAPVDGFNPRSGQQPRHFPRHGPPQPRLAHHHFGNALAERMGQHPPAGSLDFGQFGHLV